MLNKMFEINLKYENQPIIKAKVTKKGLDKLWDDLNRKFG